MNIEQAIATRCRVIDRALDRYVPDRRDSLSRAMRYGLFPGGKRLRSVLLLATGEAVGGRRQLLVPFACGIEMIHTYSLIHDDLPAMDDDLLRRGRPTAHRVFGEGLAILAGDALLTEAFRVMVGAGRGNGSAATPVMEAVQTIAVAAGMHGMVAGQVADLDNQGRRVNLATVRSIHARKTGALIEAAVRAGGLLGGASHAALRALGRFGRALGLAVQIADDLRDTEASTAVTGKVAGRDQALGKATYPAVLGTAATRAALDRQLRGAIRALRPLGERPVLLHGLTRQVGEWGAATAGVQRDRTSHAVGGRPSSRKTRRRGVR